MFRKYPRTAHLEGSRLQPGDEDLAAVPFRDLAGRYLVVEEKVDGANAGVSFDEAGLRLQSRGHVLAGGPRERQFGLFKAWAARHQDQLRAVLGKRYIMYGEWLYAKHTIFYDQLPHYFLEFDVLDQESGVFLSTERRRALLAGLPVVSVPVLREGIAESLTALWSLITGSRFKSIHWRERLIAVASEQAIESGRVVQETDPDDRMEGLYIKVEAGGEVVGRYKLIRPSFLTSVLDSGSHWQDRPILPNQLRAGVDLFGEMP